MRALVISGGGSRGAFAGGVAQYLIRDIGYQYDIFVGSSTGSLLISHLALDQVEKIRTVFTTVDQNAIFSRCPFIVDPQNSTAHQARINHMTVIKQFFRGRKTFGESNNLKRLIRKTFTRLEFDTLKDSAKNIIVTVSNLSLNRIEYKSIRDFSYEDFCDWIWISCNFIPFMSLVVKDGCEYADGGFGSKVPIEEAINRGAKVVDVIVLDAEVSETIQHPSKNVFSLVTHLNLYMAERIARQNIRIGKLSAKANNVNLNFYYAPASLTSNSSSLVFDPDKMSSWWQMGYDYARNKNSDSNELRNIKSE